MVTVYPACFYEEEEGGYSVVFPDLNHLATCGDNLQEAIDMAVDCLAGYLYDCMEDGEEVPAPSAKEDIDVDAEYDGYKSVIVKDVAVNVAEYACQHF